MRLIFHETLHEGAFILTNILTCFLMDAMEHEVIVCVKTYAVTITSVMPITSYGYIYIYTYKIISFAAIFSN